MQLGSAHPCLIGRSTQHGVALVALLVALLVLSLATQRVASVLSEQSSRDREHETLMLGTLYAQAIKSFFEASPGTVKQLPQRLDDLLEDKRYVYIKRHLRKAYKDPLSLGENFGLILDNNGRIKGVYSAPLSATSSLVASQEDGIRISYSEVSRSWQFVFDPPVQATPPTQSVNNKGKRP